MGELESVREQSGAVVQMREVAPAEMVAGARDTHQNRGRDPNTFTPGMCGVLKNVLNTGSWVCIISFTFHWIIWVFNHEVLSNKPMSCRATAVAVAAFLDAFQKVADLATNSRGTNIQLCNSAVFNEVVKFIVGQLHPCFFIPLL